MCGAFERKEIWFLGIEKIINTLDTAIRNGQVYHWNLKIKIWLSCRTALMGKLVPLYNVGGILNVQKYQQL